MMMEVRRKENEKCVKRRDVRLRVWKRSKLLEVVVFATYLRRYLRFNCCFLPQ